MVNTKEKQKIILASINEARKHGIQELENWQRGGGVERIGRELDADLYETPWQSLVNFFKRKRNVV